MSSTITKYKDGIWSSAGTLNYGRFGHGAITHEGITMIIGGLDGSGST